MIFDTINWHSPQSDETKAGIKQITERKREYYIRKLHGYYVKHLSLMAMMELYRLIKQRD